MTVGDTNMPAKRDAEARSDLADARRAARRRTRRDEEKALPRTRARDATDTAKRDRFLVRGGLGTVLASQMVDSGALASDGPRLRARLRRDGYALLRGFLDARAVDKARAVALEALAESRPEAFVADPSARAKGALRPDARALGLLARQDVAARREIRDVTECDALFRLAARVLFSDDDDSDDDAEATRSARRRAKRRDASARGAASNRRAMTAAYKWLRAVAAGEFTGVHTDRVFLGGGSGRLVTAWIPLGDVRVADGALMVAAGSHADATFAGVRRTYGASAAGRDGARSGWLTDDAAAVRAIARRANGRGDGDDAVSEPGDGARVDDVEAHDDDAIDWRTCDFRSGDVVLLAPDVAHMSLANVSGEDAAGSGPRARVSVDTRWKPEGDDPDPRVRVWRRRREGTVETVTL